MTSCPLVGLTRNAKISEKPVSHFLWALEDALAASTLHSPPPFLCILHTKYVADNECYSFANSEMSSILAKMHFLYDLHLVDSALDWEGQSHIHVQWWKPALRIRIEKNSK